MSILKYKKVLAIFAHPDDEAFSCAGTLYKLSQNGAKIDLICATRGEEGSCGNPPICKPFELGEVRPNELKCSGKILGLNKLYFLGLRDGSLTKFSKDYLVNLIIPVIYHEKPDLIITYAPTGISGHDDHIAISKAVLKAFKKFKFETNSNIKLFYSTLPESMISEMRKQGAIRDIFRHPFKGTKDKKIDYKIDIRKVLSIKIKALHCHQTQHQDWERFLKRIPEGYQDFEYFVEYNNL